MIATVVVRDGSNAVISKYDLSNLLPRANNTAVGRILQHIAKLGENIKIINNLLIDMASLLTKGIKRMNENKVRTKLKVVYNIN